MSLKSVISGLAIVLAGAAGAQTTPVTGAFVSTLGVDTISAERYRRTSDKIEGDVLLRYPRVRVIHYVGDLSAGKFRGISVSTRRPDLDPGAPPIFSMVTLIAGSSASVTVQRAGKPDTVNSGTRTFRGRVVPAFPSIPPSIGMYEQMLAGNPPVGRDSMILTTISAGAGPNQFISLLRRSRDTVAFVSSFSPGWVEVVRVDAGGRIQTVDASATTVKALTRRVGNLDFDAMLKSWTAVEASKGVAGQMSPPDTVRATIGSATVEVAYSRPFRRGRVIFGNVVPWNQVWRTGANAATQFTTSADLMFGNTPVPAGKYTLWSLPTATGSKLIINSQTGQWGTEYDMKRDFARLDLTTAPLATPIDEFTFAVAPQGNGGVLKFSWDDREYSIPFRVK